jgi:hypothetical protein
MLPIPLVALIVASLLGPGAATAPAPHHASYAANRAAAVREAKRLVRDARVPAGSERLRHAPKRLRQPASTSSGVYVDRARFWRTDVSFATAERWIRRHRPAGLGYEGSGSSGRIDPRTHSMHVTSRDVEFDGRATTAYTYPELQIEFVRGARDTTLWRVDGTVAPLDPRPLRDTYRGSRTRITTDTGCPSTQRGLGDVRNSGAQLRRHLLPAGRPFAVLLCSYHGLNGAHRLALRAHGRFGPRIAARLAHRVRAMSLAHVDGAEYSCPLDDGRADVAVFAFHGRPDVAILAHPRGCPSADNGIIVGGDPFGSALGHLLRGDH